MHMLLRFLLLRLQKSRLRPSHFGETTIHHMRVLPVDLDVLMHVNNGMYFSYMDFGRWNMIFRNGVYDLSRKKGWYSVVAGETIKFRKSLKLWDRFSIKTRIIGFDEKYFYIRQTFIKGQDVMAIGMVKIRFLKVAGGTLSTQEIMNEFPLEDRAALKNDVPQLGEEWFDLENKYLIES